MSAQTKTMNKRAEDQLVGAVREVSALVEGGSSPTAAIIKVSSDLSLGPGMVPLVVQAYNVGRTTWQQNSSTGILGKQADFPIARIEDVMGTIYPESPATPGQQKASSAVSPVYNRPPDGLRRDDVMAMEKTAHFQLPSSPVDRDPGDPMIKMSKAFGQAQREKRAIDEAKYQQNVARDHYLAAMGQVCEYFKQAAYWRRPFAEVEYNAQLILGTPAKHALDYAYTTMKLTEKRASGPPTYLAPADPTEAPYSLIAEAINRGREVIKASQHHQAVKQAADEKIAEIVRPFAQAPSSNDGTTPSSVLGDFQSQFLATVTPVGVFGKESGLFGGMAMVGLGAAARGAATQPPEDQVAGAEMELSDPEHLMELRQIETRAMLSDLINNDEVISGYDPEEVMQAYNEIAQLSPRSAMQPAVIRPLLRKQLSQGAMEPFEAQQMAEIEKTLGQTGMFSDESIPGNPSLGEKNDPKKTNEVLGGSSILQ